MATVARAGGRARVLAMSRLLLKLSAEHYGFLPNGTTIIVALIFQRHMLTRSDPTMCIVWATLFALFVYLARFRWVTRELKRRSLVSAAKIGSSWLALAALRLTEDITGP